MPPKAGDIEAVAAAAALCAPFVASGRAGELSADDASRLTDVSLLDPPLSSSPARSMALVRNHYATTASWALYTTEWMDALSVYLLRRGITRVLEVCAGLGALTRPMTARGLEWTATDLHPRPTRTGQAEPICEPIECGARAAVSKFSSAQAVFWSWWTQDELDEDFHVLWHCWERGVPVIFVGEGMGGVTGSTMLWSSGAPIEPLTTAAVREGDSFVDVPCWPGCSDRTWIVAGRVQPTKDSAVAQGHGDCSP